MVTTVATNDTESIAQILEANAIHCQTLTLDTQSIDRVRADATIDVIITTLSSKIQDWLAAMARQRTSFASRAWLQTILLVEDVSYELIPLLSSFQPHEILLKPVEPHVLVRTVSAARERANAKRHQVLQNDQSATLLRRFLDLGQHVLDGLRQVGAPDEVTGGNVYQLTSVMQGHGAWQQDSKLTAHPRQLTAERLRVLIRARTMRKAFFPAELFADPAWDMLLDLLYAHLTDRPLYVSSLCIAAGVPTTTALRRLDELVELKLVERLGDPTDKRRTIVRLTPDGLKRTQQCVETLCDAIARGDEGPLRMPAQSDKTVEHRIRLDSRTPLSVPLQSSKRPLVRAPPQRTAPLSSRGATEEKVSSPDDGMVP
jgi:DNA-binding MarR family transcriptional regulator